MKISIDMDRVDVPSKLTVDELCNIIRERFADIEYLENTPDDPDNFYTKYSYMPYVAPEPKLVNVWVHGEQKFMDLDLTNVDEGELYIYDNKCYCGMHMVTKNEYNSLTAEYESARNTVSK
jgi:hypothetical protein